MLVGGIDEAGRGPVIGPLVVAGVVVDVKDLFRLKEMGVKDSKLIASRKRENLFEEIQKVVKGFHIVVVDSGEVDDALNSEVMNLNWLEAKKSAEVINVIRPEKVIVDCPSPNLEAYKNFIKRYVAGVEVVVEHKADLNHVVVGAASILAKVVRDREIEKLKKEIGEDFGSGYPSDPVTQKFLEENWEKRPDIFRKTWTCYKILEDRSKQTTLF